MIGARGNCHGVAAHLAPANAPYAGWQVRGHGRGRLDPLERAELAIDFLCGVNGAPSALIAGPPDMAGDVVDIARAVAVEHGIEAVARTYERLRVGGKAPSRTRFDIDLIGAWGIVDALPRLAIALLEGVPTGLRGDPASAARIDRLAALASQSLNAANRDSIAIRRSTTVDLAVPANAAIIDGVGDLNGAVGHLALAIAGCGGTLPNRPHNLFLPESGVAAAEGSLSIRRFLTCLETAFGEAGGAVLQVCRVDGGTEDRYTKAAAPGSINAVICGDIAEAIERAGFVAALGERSHAMVLSRQDGVIEAAADALGPSVHQLSINPERHADTPADEAALRLLESALRAQRRWLDECGGLAGAADASGGQV